MTIHVTVSDAEKRLAELVSAAARGEDVLLDQEGGPQARLVGVMQASPKEIERRAAKRQAAIGMFEDLIGDREIDIVALRAEDRWDEHYRRKFGDLS